MPRGCDYATDKLAANYLAVVKLASIAFRCVL